MKIFSKNHGWKKFFANKNFVLLVSALVIVLVLGGINSVEKTKRVSAGSSQNLSGYAWSDLIGWLSFNCSDSNTCSTSGQTSPTISISTTTPANTAATVDVRGGNTATPDGTWTAWQTGVINGALPSALNNKRYLQYRSNLSTTNSAATPSLDSISLTNNSTTVTHTTDTDFGAGTQSSTAVAGTGSGASVALASSMGKNYATWNPADASSNVALSGGNLVATWGATTAGLVRSTIGKSSGKWYWEVTTTVSTNGPILGIATNVPSTSRYIGQDATSWGYYGLNGNKYNGAGAVAYGATYAAGDVIGIALDMDAGTVTFYKNGVSQGVAFTGLTGTIYAAGSLSGNATLPVQTANFGATVFAYTPPAGYNSGLYVDAPPSECTGGTITHSGGNTIHSFVFNPVITMNPSDKGANLSLYGGNMVVRNGGSNVWNSVRSTANKSSGKWYWEARYTTASASHYALVGIANSSGSMSTYIGIDGNSVGYDGNDGKSYNNNVATVYGATYTQGDVIGVALDVPNTLVTFYKNGVSQGQLNYSSGMSGSIYPAVSLYSSGDMMTVNLGASTFAYTPPTGYSAFDSVAAANNTLTCSGSGSVDYLVVAGGGGGARSQSGWGGNGGGGAGGMLTGSAAVAAQSYPITIGTGGSGAATNLTYGENGTNSVFSTATAVGGGGGGRGNCGGGGGNGLAGGSGGGAGQCSGTGGAGTSGQGNAGGNVPSNNNDAAGGGGAGGVGGSTSASNAGSGGVGLASSISGSSVFYAGGGGGGDYNVNGSGGGGNGGGGAGGGAWNSGSTGGNATANTGGGGGGSVGDYWGGNGGSGIVIVRYGTPSGYAASGVFTSPVIDFGAIAPVSTDYGVNINPSTGAFSGYAWSDNIGWVSFNSADTVNCPSAPCSPTLSTTTGAITGWARALSGASATSLTYNVTTPANTTATLDIRGGNTASPDGTWTAWQTGVTNGTMPSILLGLRYYQYRANLATSNGVSTPSLDSISITANSNTVTQTADTDFSSGTLSNAQVTGTGSGASLTLIPVNGVCGSANGVAVTSAPSANLCSAGTASSVTGTGPWNWTCNGSAGGTNASCSAPSGAAPTSLALTQTANHRDFTVSWTGGTGNGGAGGCRLEYYTGSVWTTLTYATYNCDANATNVAAQLLNTDNFSASTWNATGLQIRLVKISDDSALGTFAQKATCSATGGSGSATPLIDEDCNKYWDNTTGGDPYTYNAGGTTCPTSGGSASPGQSYTCSAPGTCNGYPTGSFNFANFNAAGTLNQYAQTDTTCSSVLGSGASSDSQNGSGSSGTAPAYVHPVGQCFNVVPGYYKNTSLGAYAITCYWYEQRTGYTAVTYY